MNTIVTVFNEQILLLLMSERKRLRYRKVGSYLVNENTCNWPGMWSNVLYSSICKVPLV